MGPGWAPGHVGYGTRARWDPGPGPGGTRTGAGGTRTRASGTRDPGQWNPGQWGTGQYGSFLEQGHTLESTMNLIMSSIYTYTYTFSIKRYMTHVCHLI